MRKPCEPSEALQRACERYLRVRRATWSPATLRVRHYALNRFVRWLARRHPTVRRFSQLRRHPHIEDWLAGRAGLKAASLQRELEILAIFFEDQIEWGWPDPPPADLIHRSDFPRLPQPNPKPLAPEDDARLLHALAEDPCVISLALRLLRHTGLRSGELLRLDAAQVQSDLDALCVLRVPPAKTEHERMIPLLEQTRGLLAAMLARRACLHRPNPQDAHWLLLDENGRRIHYHTLWRYLKATARAAGIRDCRAVCLHRLRHTFASEMARRGLPFPTLMRLLGHRKPEMTMRYIRLTAEDVRAAYAKVIAELPALPPCLPPPESIAAPDTQLLIRTKFDSLIHQIDHYRRDLAPHNPRRQHLLRLEKRLRAALASFEQAP